MRNLTAIILIGALALICPAPSLAAETAEGDASQFLKQFGMETIHETYVKFFTLLSEEKIEAAAQFVIDSLPAHANEAFREQCRSLTTTFSKVFVRGVDDVELVGALKLSSKSVALYYILNSTHGPVLVIWMPFYNEGNWRTHSFYTESDVAKILERLKGTNRFSESIVVPLKRLGKTA